MRKFDFEVLGMGMHNGNYAGAFTTPVRSLISSMVSGNILHLYSGSSLLGNVRIDVEHPNATCNMRVEDFISLDNRNWDWLILDPPYAITRANLKLKDYGEYDRTSGNVKWWRMLKRYCQNHIDNVLWLDFCAPMIKGFRRQKLWLLLPGGFHTVRVLSWLKKEMQPLL